MRAILGNGWTAFALTIIFGQSIFLLRLLNWWTATANILPSSVCMLFAFWCYLRWRESGSRKLLIGSFAAFAVSLLDYETAILFPAYLALVSGLVLERRPGIRSWVALVRRERWAWTGYIVLDVAALINFYSFYYSPTARPSLHAIGSYLLVALFETFVPALVGIKYPANPGSHHAVIVAACLVVGAAIVVTLYLRPRAWRCLLAFAGVFLITMLPVGLTRVKQFGVSIGHVVYYQQSVQFMFLILAAFALSPRWSGRRPPRAVTGPRALAARVLRTRLSRRRTAAVAGAAAIAAYAALYLTSLHTMSEASWQPRQDVAYVQQFLAGVARLRRTTGSEPVLVDLKVPKQVLPVKLWPYTTYGQFFALFDPHLRTDALASRLYVVGRHGRLIRVAFRPSTGGLISHAHTGAGRSAAHSTSRSDQRSVACVPGAPHRVWLRIPIARPQAVRPPPTNGVPAALSVRYRMPTSADVVVKLLSRGAERPFGTVTHTWASGQGDDLIPLGFTGVLGAVEFLLPPHGCIAGFTLGRLRFAQAPTPAG